MINRLLLLNEQCDIRRPYFRFLNLQHSDRNGTTSRCDLNLYRACLIPGYDFERFYSEPCVINKSDLVRLRDYLNSIDIDDVESPAIEELEFAGQHFMMNC